jgi:phage shock protein PspC (stress-responsive transcriptional regulator)
MGTRIETIEQLAAAVRSDPALAARVRDNPAEVLAGLASPLQSDVWIYRLVVGALALAILITVIGAILLALQDKAVPDVMLAIGSGAVGALAGLLAPSPAAGRR